MNLPRSFSALSVFHTHRFRIHTYFFATVFVGFFHLTLQNVVIQNTHHADVVHVVASVEDA